MALSPSDDLKKKEEQNRLLFSGEFCYIDFKFPVYAFAFAKCT